MRYALVLLLFVAVVYGGVTSEPAKEDNYDFIVVGGGSSGATVAGRLAEMDGKKVLLLEAGPDVRAADLPDIMRKPNPSYAAFKPECKKFRWENMLVTRTATQEKTSWIHGKGIGGSSLINGQIAVRGRKEDYENWSPRWNWDTILPYFKKSETDFKFGDKPFHGSNGPTPITRLEEEDWGSIDRAHRDAAISLGFKWAEDNNDPSFTDGVSYSAINNKDGYRMTTMDSYVEPQRSNPNFVVRGDTLVDKVLFDSDNVAYGVQAISGGKTVTYKGREIILSAGVVHSPAILMRSGIGPAADLEELGIAVVHDNSHVGKNLHEHPLVNVLVNLKDEFLPKSPFARSTSITTRFSSDGKTHSNLAFLSMNQVGDPTTGPAPFGAVSALLFYPHSRGHVRLTSTDPTVEPEVNLGILSDKRDFPLLRTAARKMFDLVRQPAFSRIAKEIVAPDGGDMVPLEEMAARSDDEIDKWMEANCADGMHGTSTCSLGKVVDDDLNVMGVKNLRVVDASIMPVAPRANTHLACVMVGEKAADIIKSSDTNSVI